MAFYVRVQWKQMFSLMSVSGVFPPAQQRSHGRLGEKLHSPVRADEMHTSPSSVAFMVCSESAKCQSQAHCPLRHL